MKLNPQRLAGVLFAATLGFVSPPAAVAKPAPWRQVQVTIPGFAFEYSIHASLKPGYRPPPREVTIKDLSAKETAFRLGRSSYEARIATYFYGVVGNFKDFDMTVTVAVLRLDEDQATKSPEDLRDWAQRLFSMKSVLKDGRDFVEDVSYGIQKIGDREVVVTGAADMYLFKEVELQGGMSTRLSPWRTYFIRLDERMVVSLRLDHLTPKKVTPRWHEETTALAEEMIRRMQFVPQPAAPK